MKTTLKLLLYGLGSSLFAVDIDLPNIDKSKSGIEALLMGRDERIVIDKMEFNKIRSHKLQNGELNSIYYMVESKDAVEVRNEIIKKYKDYVVNDGVNINSNECIMKINGEMVLVNVWWSVVEFTHKINNGGTASNSGNQVIFDLSKPEGEERIGINIVFMGKHYVKKAGNIYQSVFYSQK